MVNQEYLCITFYLQYSGKLLKWFLWDGTKQLSVLKPLETYFQKPVNFHDRKTREKTALAVIIILMIVELFT